jgi:hypothetical protein
MYDEKINVILHDHFLSTFVRAVLCASGGLVGGADLSSILMAESSWRFDSCGGGRNSGSVIDEESRGSRHRIPRKQPATKAEAAGGAFLRIRSEIFFRKAW